MKKQRPGPEAIELSYVNMARHEKDYDKEFRSMAALRKFVRERHPKWTSYQVIVVNRRQAR